MYLPGYLYNLSMVVFIYATKHKVCVPRFCHFVSNRMQVAKTIGAHLERTNVIKYSNPDKL